MKNDIPQNDVYILECVTKTIYALCEHSGLPREKVEELILAILKNVYTKGLNQGTYLTLAVTDKR